MIGKQRYIRYLLEDWILTNHDLILSVGSAGLYVASILSPFFFFTGTGYSSNAAERCHGKKSI